ncbi:major facilitator superfamily domain-containing protein [Fimicolochytrium jonesii]|uniref:major facilitator superfamily domain-containing protein n=1 Tax=Fimicolochytrium jonesii TaxID=1396493 RepID=UPI0022FF20D3|nr:major facilitator superfamily domain-containing protein [Fimicolochytrium jonesii]KAI8824510.1 major facilitator superfamily domain-containing protein [Fimicolochytrium jonesii]
MILLTICLTGVQITWTVELAYGNPYLQQLNLPHALSALVWLAGPLSGLLIQPIVGVYSDKCSFRIGRRRPFMLVGGLIVLASIAMIAYAPEIAQLFTGSKDAKRNEVLTIMSAVLGFYCLDFSINAVQASCRSLIVDVAPIHQQETANAWGGRMIGIGNVVGYFLGFLDLPRFFPFFGHGQMRVFCWLASIWFALSLGATCLAVQEKRYVPKRAEKLRAWYEPLLDIGKAMRGMPETIQRICLVQFFGWMGFFPFLFYSTTWVGQKAIGMHKGIGDRGRDSDEATRAGSFAMLMYSLISLATGFLLPMITVRRDEDDGRWVDSHLHPVLQKLKALHYKYLRLPVVWAFAFWFFVALMFSTLFINSVLAATIVIASVGVSWGIMQWVPFTLLGECINYYNDNRTLPRENPSSAQGSSANLISGYGSLPRIDDDDDDDDDDHIPPYIGASTQGIAPSPRASSPTPTTNSTESLEAGMVLGIHNIYIVIPQFFSTFMCSVVFTVFHLIEKRNAPGDKAGDKAVDVLGDLQPDPYDSVGWVLRIGAASGIIAGFVALRVKEVPRISGMGNSGVFAAGH